MGETKWEIDVAFVRKKPIPTYWLEFCPPCGEKQKVTNKITGEQLRLVDYYARMWDQNFQEGGKNG